MLAAFGTDEAIAAAAAGRPGTMSPRRGGAVITVSYVLATLAAIGFGYRLLVGPSLTDRVVGIDGLLLVGVTAIVAAGDGDRGGGVPAGRRSS